MPPLDIFYILNFIGFPTLFALFLYILKRVMALNYGIQAVLRDRLRYLYKEYEKRGWVDLDDREDWINMYNQYHTLGRNGVMDDIEVKFLALPTHPSREKKSQD